MTKRVLSGIGANLYGQTVTVVAQVGTVPVLLHVWGSQGLGGWLTLVAWTSVLSLTDGGMMVAAGNAAVLAAGRGDPAAAGSILRALMHFVLRVGGGLAVVLLACALILVGHHGGPDIPALVTIVALGLAALAGLPLGTVELGFRAAGHYARGMVLTSSIRLAETAAVMLAGFCGGSPAAAAAVLLLTRIGGGLAAGLLLRREVPQLWAAGHTGRPNPLRTLVRPALAALAIPAALACNLQGMTIAASLVVPAEAVAGFVAARTVTRLLVQAIGLLTHAQMPEYGLAVGRGDEGRRVDLLRTNLFACIVVLVPGWAALVAFGPALMARWTGPDLRPDPLVFDLLASAALAHGFWLSAANLLLAANRQAEFAYRGLAVAASSCAGAALLGAVWSLRGVALASLLGELAMAALILPAQVAAVVRPAAAPEPVGAG